MKTTIEDVSVSVVRRPRIYVFLGNITSWLMPIAAVFMLILMIWAMKIAKSWPFVHDAPLMHYTIFLMEHGLAPYRDIVEMNMPGTYIFERLIMHSLGGGAFGWWMSDALSGIVAVVTSAWIAGRGRRSAGFAGAVLAYLFHLRSGPGNLGQRDWIVGVLLLTAFGFMFEAIRKQQPVWMAGFMVFCGFAATIKPPAMIFGIGFLIATCWLVRKKYKLLFSGWVAYPLWSIVGGLVPALMTAYFLFHYGVTSDFRALLHGLVPYYASLHRLHFVALVKRLIVLQPLLLTAAFALFVLGRSWKEWEADFLGLAISTGVMLFLIQGKGWEYHLYPAIAFATLWAMLELDKALKAAKWQQIVGAIALVVVVFGTTPRLLIQERASSYPMQTITHLESDLRNLGGSKLSGKIQCLDMTMGGCINVLYRMKLIQSTGFIYDFYLFPRQPNAVTESLQARFLQEITFRPPGLIVLSSHTWPSDTYSYQQIDNWPAFSDLLHRKYDLIREFPNQAKSAYRIYRLHGSNPQLAEQAP